MEAIVTNRHSILHLYICIYIYKFHKQAITMYEAVDKFDHNKSIKFLINCWYTPTNLGNKNRKKINKLILTGKA